ncbi:MAG TPA: hypothetical protein VFU88_18125 [Ktedonobacterales bacterium]|jgi:PspAA-like protein|nr:hypothetical protein [Ktedonobacterales bacterium]
MIVRIMADNQYRLDDSKLAQIDQLDDAMDAAMAAGDQAAFASALDRLVDYVKANGQPLPIDEVVASDLIVPAPDMSLDEAKARLHTIEAQQRQPSE